MNSKSELIKVCHFLWYWLKLVNFLRSAKNFKVRLPNGPNFHTIWTIGLSATRDDYLVWCKLSTSHTEIVSKVVGSNSAYTDVTIFKCFIMSQKHSSFNQIPLTKLAHSQGFENFVLTANHFMVMLINCFHNCDNLANFNVVYRVTNNNFSNSHTMPMKSRLKLPKQFSLGNERPL